jgi:hypothetical protein
MKRRFDLFNSDDGLGANDEVLMSIVSRTPKLTRLHSQILRPFNFSWETFRCLADSAGASLLEFENIPVRSATEFCDASTLRSFTALRSLVWHCPAKFEANEQKDLKDCFPRLTTLRISSCDPSFLKLILHIE